MTTEPMLALARQAIAIVMSHVRVTTCGATALNVGDVEKELVAALSRTPPVDQDEVERAAKAIETEIEEQTGGAWPIKVGDDLHLVDAELDLRAIARAALASIRGGDDARAG